MKKNKTVKIITAIIAALITVSSGAVAPVVTDNSVISVSAHDELKLDKSSISLGLGEKYTLKSNDPSVVWRTSDSKVLTVSQKGKVTAVGCGTAWITIRSQSGTETSCKITVKKAPESVSFSEKSVVMAVGEHFSLSSVIPQETSAASRLFKCTDPTILEMTRTNWVGEFTALKEGTAKVKVVLYNGVKSSINVTVKKPASSISLSASKITLGAGETYSLTASFPKGTASVNQTYLSSNASVATVSGKGKNAVIKAVAPGEATISVKTFNGKLASCKVFVKKSPEKVSISKSVITLGVGESSSLSYTIPDSSAANSVCFRTSNSSVVKMTKTNGEGKFTAVAPGVAWVTVRLYNGKEASCRINVREAPSSVTLTRNTLTLVPGQKYTLGSAVNDGAAAMKRTYSSSDSSIIKMTRTDWVGEFTAKAPGVAYVKVRTYNGKESTCKIIVADNGFDFDLPNDPIVLDPGDTYRIKCNGSIVNCRTEDTSVVSVSNSGVVSANSPGTTNVIVTTDNGRTARAEIIVLGTKSYCVFPEMYEVSGILNSAKLVPMKTNCSEVDSLAGSIISRVVTNDMSNAQKTQALYDYLVKTCTYGYGGYKAINAGSYQNESDKEIVEFSYCILKNNIGTCENFSAAYTVLLRRLGFEANQIYGDVGMSAGGYGGHYWVDVNIDGKHYIFDPQVENNNFNGVSIMHYFFGMRPENNYHMYHYEYVNAVHGFKR